MNHASACRIAVLALSLAACTRTLGAVETATSTTPASALSPSPASAGPSRQAAFAAAAREFGVPLPVLLAVSYQETHWEAHAGQPSYAAGYGPMNLSALTQADLDRVGFTSTFRSPDLLQAPALHTAAAAAPLAGVDVAAVQADAVANIRAGAALLASYERTYRPGRLPPAWDLPAWTVAVARYAQASETMPAQVFADDVYALIRRGRQATTQDGQTLDLAAVPWAFAEPQAARRLHLTGVVPPADPVHNPALLDRPECPASLDCSYSPSGFFQLDPADKSSYGDHDPAQRPATTDVRFITLHDNEESRDGTLWLFHDPSYFASAHYEVRADDGQVTQQVPTRQVAWDSANESFYQHSIGIEQEGYAIRGATWYTEAMYRSTAALVRYLAGRYHIALDRQHVLGHDNIPGSSDARIGTQHWDPGPFWDWSHFMDLLGAPLRPSAGPRSNVVTIAPPFRLNRQVVTACENIQSLTPYPGPYHGAEWPNLNGPCPESYHLAQPSQPVNFLWLHTRPSDDAPLLADVYLHPDGSAGTRHIEDWGDQASTGQTFAVADRAAGGWVAIWFGGQKAWLRDRVAGVPATLPSRGWLVKPKAGRAGVPIYVTSFPEASAYPAAFVSWYGGLPRGLRIATMYAFGAGQAYVTDGHPVRSDWFNASYIDGSGFMDQTDFVGSTSYYLITYNHRMAYVDAADVDVVASGP